MNKLFYGDNLTIMQQMPAHSVDLIYLDPPFNSKKNYNLMYKNMTGKPVSEQVEAFCDTWDMDEYKEEIARTMPILMKEHGIDDYYIEFWKYWIEALRATQPQLLAYLIYMVQRLMYMKNILKPTGSIYLHCDPSASHYIKVMMDGIFGSRNFRNEIIWKRTSAHGNAKRWGPIHDVIFFYTVSDKYTWNRTYEKYNESYIKNSYKYTDEHGRYLAQVLDGPGTRNGDSGKPWRGIDPTVKGRHWAIPSLRAIPEWAGIPENFSSMTTQERLDILDTAGLIHWPKKGSVPHYKRYLDVSLGNTLQDMILDISPLSGNAKERLGYPTQKPTALLERIISASSKPGDVVFDPFCGCGTTIYASQKLDRKWIGCDIAILAVKLICEVLTEKSDLAEGVHFEVDGIPVTIEQAEVLFRKDPFQFQHWIVERVGGFPMQKKTADKGIDGRLYFESQDKLLKEMVLSVKGGAVHPTDVRDLRGVLERENNAELAGLVTLKEPTKAMREEAAKAGLYEYLGVKYPRIQMLTVKEILEDKKEFRAPAKVASTKISTGRLHLGI